MTPAPATDPLREPRRADSTVGRSNHRLLRAEKAQLNHWRRLLRARLDLAVAGLAPPERLGVLTSDLLPDAVADLPEMRDLMSAVSVPSAEDTVDLMNRIRVLDRTLRGYAERIDEALEESTRALVRDLADARPASPDAPSSSAPTPV